MAMLTVPDLPDDAHEILAAAGKPEPGLRLGEMLAALGREVGLTDEECEVFEQVRDKTPTEPLRFE